MLRRASTAALLCIACIVPAASGVACGSSSGGGGASDPGATCAEGTPGCLGWVACPAGFEKDTSTPETPEAAGCRDVQPDADCAPGTMPTLGSRDCQPVGATTCAAGFTRAASGWGCDEVLPAVACTGATRESLGATTCQPVGDCSAAFPPAAATVFVNAAYADAQLDGAHFRAIGDAVAAAPSGATIAVEAGTYAEGIGPKRAVTVVGRCAEKVRLVGTGLQFPGVYSFGVKGIVVSGLTLEDHFQGVRVQAGGGVTVSDVVIESPRLGGLIAYQPGSAITASRVVVRGARPESASGYGVGANADAGAKLELADVVLAASADVGLSATNGEGESKTPSVITARRTVIRDTRPSKRSPAGSGVAAFDGSSVELDQSVVSGTYGFGVLVELGGARANLKSSVVRGTQLSPDDGIGGGVLAYDESVVALDGVTVVDNDQAGVYVRGKATLNLNSSVVVGSRPQSDGDFGMGLWADQGASVAITSSALVDNGYYGMAALDPGTRLQASQTLVRGTRRNADDGLGRGLDVEAAASATLDDVSFVGNGDESLFVRGGVAGKGRSQVTASRIIVRDTRSRRDGTTGDGISVQGGALLELDVAAVVRARRAGILLNDRLSPDGLPSEATVAHTIVRETQAAGDGLDEKIGIPLEGVGIANGGKLTLASSAVIGSVEFGVVFGGVNSSGSVDSSIIRGTSPRANGDFGHGFVGVDGASVVVKNTVILGNRIGVAFESATATLASVLVQQNAVGIHVQGRSQLLTSAAAPAEQTPEVVVVTDDSRFIGNDTRIGSGTVPLPTGPLGPSDPDAKAPTKTK
jgi:hypothetical protein